MIRFQTTLFTVTALVGLTSVATAQGHYKTVPPVKTISNWTGFYAGVNLGGGIGVDSTSQSVVLVSSVLGTNGILNSNETLAPAGVVLGGQVGYNWFVSRAVVGLEADWQWTSQKDNASANTPASNDAFFAAGANGFGYDLRTQQKIDNFGTLRAKAGVPMHKSLWYLTGGLAWGTVKSNYLFVGTANSDVVALPGPFFTTGANFSTDRLGWTVGTGIESTFENGWSVKFEYLYVDLGRVNNQFNVNVNTSVLFRDMPIATASSSSRVNDNIFRVGANYTFNL